VKFTDCGWHSRLCWQVCYQFNSSVQFVHHLLLPLQKYSNLRDRGHLYIIPDFWPPNSPDLNPIDCTVCLMWQVIRRTTTQVHLPPNTHSPHCDWTTPIMICTTNCQHRTVIGCRLLVINVVCQPWFSDVCSSMSVGLVAGRDALGDGTAEVCVRTYMVSSERFMK